MGTTLALPCTLTTETRQRESREGHGLLPPSFDSEHSDSSSASLTRWIPDTGILATDTPAH